MNFPLHHAAFDALGEDCLAVLTLSSGECRWPSGEGDETTFCRASQRTGSSYCDHHYMIAYPGARGKPVRSCAPVVEIAEPIRVQSIRFAPAMRVQGGLLRRKARAPDLTAEEIAPRVREVVKPQQPVAKGFVPKQNLPVKPVVKPQQLVATGFIPRPKPRGPLILSIDGFKRIENQRPFHPSDATLYESPLRVPMRVQIEAAELIRQANGRPSVQTVLKAVASAYRVTYGELIGPRRTGRLILPRKVAAWVLRTCRPDKSLPAIGRAMNRDHTTILHACRRADAMIANGSLRIPAHLVAYASGAK